MQNFLKKKNNGTTCWAISTKSWWTPIYLTVQLNIEFHKNPWNNFFVTNCNKIFVTDTHFLSIVKSCSGHPKTCKSSKTGNRKFLHKLLLLLFIQKKVKSHITDMLIQMNLESILDLTAIRLHTKHNSNQKFKDNLRSDKSILYILKKKKRSKLHNIVIKNY